MMSDKMIENNQVSIVGEVVSDFTFSHEVFGEGFYMLNVSVKRLSDSCDMRITGEPISVRRASFGPTIGTRRRRTVWFFLYL